MKLFPDSGLRFLHVLLLLAQTCVCSVTTRQADYLWSRTMTYRLGQLKRAAATEFHTMQMETDDYRLEHLPTMLHTVNHLHTLKLSELYLGLATFKLHVAWLDTAKMNVSMASLAAGGAGDQRQHHIRTSHLLRQLCDFTRAALQKIHMEVPAMPSLSLPAVSDTFDVLHYSTEVAQRLKVFCDWSMRVVHLVRSQYRNLA